MFDVIGSIIISLRCCCLPNDEGLVPPNIFPRTAAGVQPCVPGEGESESEFMVADQLEHLLVSEVACAEVVHC